MRTTFSRYRSPYAPRASRWRTRLLYTLAGIGFLALVGLAGLVYQALQVPERNLAEDIPFPTLASPAEKIEAVPNLNAATGNLPAANREPAYSYFYTTQPSEAERPKMGKPLPRPKPVKRATPAAKPKKSS